MRAPMKNQRLVPIAVLALLVACASAPPTPKAAEDAPPPVTVVALSDFHGALEPTVTRTQGGEPVESGGAALVAAYVERLRATAPGPVVVVDGGDMFQGTLVSNRAEGAPVVRFYDRLGVAAAALGNHEFDYGPAGPKPIPLEPGDDPRGALRARAEEAHFPILACNVVNAEGKRPDFLGASTMVDAGGVKVGIVGAATPATPMTTVRANLVGLTFEDPQPCMISEARRLRAEGAQIVVAILHDGSNCRPGAETDLSTCDPGAYLDLASALPEGLVDVLVGAHTHGGVARRLGHTALIQPYARGQYLAWAVVRPGAAPEVDGPVRLCGETVPSAQGPTCLPKVVEASQGPVSPAAFRGETVAPDPVVAAALVPDLEKARAVSERPLGLTLPAPVGRSYHGESDLGDLVADAFRLAWPEADAAVTNSGGLRADLPAGPLTYGDVFAALPFENRLAILTVDGATLRRIVELGYAGGHGALQWSGLGFEADGCEVGAIRVNGKPLDPERVYTLVTNDYLAGGGSGFDRLGLDPEAADVRYDRPFLRDLVADALEHHGTELLKSLAEAQKTPRQVVTGRCERGGRHGG